MTPEEILKKYRVINPEGEVDVVAVFAMNEYAAQESEKARQEERERNSRIENTPKNLQPVSAVQDDDGHWYVIPDHLEEDFYNDLEDEDMVYRFDGKYGSYRTGGDLNLVQLYAEL